jgi:hypothetical protein
VVRNGLCGPKRPVWPWDLCGPERPVWPWDLCGPERPVWPKTVYMALGPV